MPRPRKVTSLPKTRNVELPVHGVPITMVAVGPAPSMVIPLMGTPTGSVYSPGPTTMVSPAAAWVSAYVMVRHGVDGSVQSPASTPAIATCRVVVAAKAGATTRHDRI